ncbi:protein of unknown function [Georgfuchsia toluolica]|uniref:Uncharacterized protein n=1 Tax=Georgfuchsia toluolica TaxID=424218 RepID=A0A916N1J5_9PROT|nr:protein of unknown function [Georgfuchsia toluolica]
MFSPSQNQYDSYQYDSSGWLFILFTQTPIVKTIIHNGSNWFFIIWTLCRLISVVEKAPPGNANVLNH